MTIKLDSEEFIGPGFRDVFSTSRLAPRSYFIKGTRRIFGECYYGKEEYPLNWLKLIQACRRLELPFTEEESDSPVNATAIVRSFPFLDGGLISREGNYFFGLKGAWVIGHRALRFVCYEMGIEQPRRFKTEAHIPSFLELFAQIESQVEDTPDQLAALHRELDGFR
jgi:hypothetical protein